MLLEDHHHAMPVPNIDPAQQHGSAGSSQPSQQPSSLIRLTLEQFRALVGIPQHLAEPGVEEVDRKIHASAVNGTDRHVPRANSVPSSYLPPSIKPATIKSSPTTRRSVLVLFGVLPRPGYVWRRRRAKATAATTATTATSGMAAFGPASPGTAISETATSEKDEYATSLYYSICQEESDHERLYHIYNVVIWASLILQLVIASALIIVGGIPSSTSTSSNTRPYKAQRIAVAVLGAVTGLLTGILSLLKGQGFPLRFLQYRSRLREVREKIEFMERQLRASINGVVVTYQDVLDIWHEYETVVKERDMNRPDAWASVKVSTKDGAAGRRG